MFGRKTRDLIEIMKSVEERVTRQKERIVDIEKALNDATKLLAEKHGIAVTEDTVFWAGSRYSPLVRLATRTTTKHIKL